jgi:hypothetical protein
MKKSAEAEQLINMIMFITHPAQFALCLSLRSQVKESGGGNVSKALEEWPSLLTGASWIYNRLTPRHRDGGGLDAGYDYLTNFGGSKLNCYLNLPDLGAIMQYRSRGLTALLGRPLSHEVKAWTGGDGVCVARWIKASVTGGMLEWPTAERCKKILLA